MHSASKNINLNMKFLSLLVQNKIDTSDGLTKTKMIHYLPLVWPSPLQPVQASPDVLPNVAGPRPHLAPTDGVSPSVTATPLHVEILPTHSAQQARLGIVETDLSFLVL